MHLGCFGDGRQRAERPLPDDERHMKPRSASSAASSHTSVTRSVWFENGATPKPKKWAKSEPLDAVAERDEDDRVGAKLGRQLEVLALE